MAGELAYRVSIHTVGSATPAMIASQCAAVTSTLKGAMTAADKIKLDSIVAGAAPFLPVHKTQNYTVLVADTNKCFTNLAATATLVYTLPVATTGSAYGLDCSFACLSSAFPMRVQVGNTTDLIYFGPAGSCAAGGFWRTVEPGATMRVAWLTSGQHNVINQPMGTWIPDA